MTAEGDIQDYTISALSALSFKIVFTEEDLEVDKAKCVFQPSMAHQVFGDKEIIFGYKDLSIDLYYLHNSSKCLLEINYSEKVKAFEVDDVIDLLNPWLPTNYVSKKEEFKKHVLHEKHDQMFGTVIHKFERLAEVMPLANKKVMCQYKVTQCDLEDQLFQEYHQRFETFIIWFIDAANFIDLSDERWLIFYIYEEFKHPDTNETIITPIGYTAIYKFFSYPSSNRARISQFFILPTYQDKGLGTELYKAVYSRIVNDMPDIVDITVEEPSEKFQRIRDICDASHIYKDLHANNKSLNTMFPKIFNKYMAKHKISKKQSARLADILGYYIAMKSGDEAVKSFTDDLLKKITSEVEGSCGLNKVARGFPQEIQDSAQHLMEQTVNARYSHYSTQIKKMSEKLKEILN